MKCPYFKKPPLPWKIPGYAPDITDSILTNKKEPMNNIYLPNYNIEHTPISSCKGGALLYISKKLNYKNRNDLKIYKDKHLESIFTGILWKSKNKSIITGCIYKHPNLSIPDFNDSFLKPLLDKLSYENKNIILLGDFNIDLLYFDSNTQTGEFLDQMYFGSSSPQITIPTRIIPRSRTVDSIFTNTVDEFAISGNLLGSVSDHLAQFLIYSDLK